MAAERIPFTAREWVPGSHPLERKKTGPLQGTALLQFEAGFEDPNWCAGGHLGIVLEGRLGLVLEDAPALVIEAGDGFRVEPGTRHRAFNPGPGAVRLFITALI